MERKILRAMTGLYRKEDGKWYNTKVLYKTAMIEESILEHMAKNAKSMRSGRRNTEMNGLEGE